MAVGTPPYLNRQGFVPRKPEEFGDGGAFPEIHVAQHPLGMGRKDSNPGSELLPVTVDSRGNIGFDAIVKQNENASKIVYSEHSDLVPKILKGEEKMEEESDDLGKEIEETTNATKAALEKIVNVRLGAAQPKQSSDCKFIKYKPSLQSAEGGFNSGSKERIIRMEEMGVDPLEPPKFKHKRFPSGSAGSPPVPVMLSPPHPVTVKDQQDWNIPPCISNWKNPKGYTIPLEKRLSADGRGLENGKKINDNFAKISEALYVAEQKAREDVALISKLQKEMVMKEKEKQEQVLRDLATKARSERTSIAPAPPVAANIDKRRLEAAKDGATGKKSKMIRDRDCDVSEKVALGMASVEGGRGEVMYDERLFNQEKGMGSGFATDDQYNVYDKGLFTAQATLSTLYQHKKGFDSELYGGADEQLDKIRKTDRFKPYKGFTGTAEKSGPSVEFEQEAADDDPFGLGQLWTSAKKG